FLSPRTPPSPVHTLSLHDALPICGTGGFLLAAHSYIAKHHDLDRDQRRFLKFDALRGWEIVDNTARLCLMNLFLHGIGSDEEGRDRKSTRLNSSHDQISYAVFCLK